MKKTAAILFIVSLFLNACTPNKPTANIPVVGEAIDSAAIAGDTLQQKSIESSYEYAQTVMVSPTLVYDIRAYGGPASHGEYAILRRGNNNISDTVVMAQRFGIIVNAFTADLNNNGKEEIYIVMRKPNSNASSYISAFEFDNTGRKEEVIVDDPNRKFTINTAVAYDSIKPGTDTIYTYKNMLVKNYVRSKDQSPERLNHAWRLDGLKLKLIPND